MILVTIRQDLDGRIRSFEMKGHADYAEHGKDLVCAGASTVSFGTVNAIYSLLQIEPEIQQGGDGGYLHVTFPQNLSEQKEQQLQLLVKAMIVQLQTIEETYGQHIKITSHN